MEQLHVVYCVDCIRTAGRVCRQQDCKQAGRRIFTTFGATGVTGLNLYSLLVSVVGAVVLLVAYHAIRRTA